MAEKKKEDELGSPKRGKKIFILIAALLLLILGVSGYFGAAYFLQLPPFEPPGPTAEEIAAQKAEEEKSQKLLQREIYVKCSDKFSFNIKSERRLHTRQVDVVLVVQGEENEALAKKHLTIIDSDIFDKLRPQTYEGLQLPS
uniref:hypothetical protein n=1 Tax=Succinivibrio sp. TaxID=2053619 RepID=UPI00402ACD47